MNYNQRLTYLVAIMSCPEIGSPILNDIVALIKVDLFARMFNKYRIIF